MEITKGKIFKYTMLPQVAPRLNTLMFSGFSNMAYFMALVYRAVNILPNNHIYLETSSIGKYTMRNVLTEAANHIDFKFKNIDQVIIFFALIVGVFLLLFQFLFLAAAIIVRPASAQEIPVALTDFFKTPTPEKDLALRMLDSVFGIPDFFGTLEPTNQGFHMALRSLFEVYSYGLLVIAALILAYFIFAVLAETAQTGTPFGKRYNHVWAPIRLVFGIGLLVPIAFGLNAGQWVTLYAAKLGSGFATTGWIIFNNEITSGQIDNDELVAKANVPGLKDLSAFMMLAQACRHGFEKKLEEIGPEDIKMYVVSTQDGGKSAVASNYANAVKLAGANDVHIRFGWKNDAYHTKAIGGVMPLCGELVLQNIVNESSVFDYSVQDGTPVWKSKGGPAAAFNHGYFQLIMDMWGRSNIHKFKDMADAGVGMMEKSISSEGENYPKDLRQKIVARADEQIGYSIPTAHKAAQLQIKEAAAPEVFGWGGASLWYNQIANANGQMTTATLNKPQIKMYPMPMEETCAENKAENNNTTTHECYAQHLANEKKVTYDSQIHQDIANGLNKVYKYWYADSDDLTGNVMIDVINAVLGLDGLFDMCANADIHPLAQLSSLGKGMIEAAIRNLGISFGSGAAGIMAGVFGPMLNAASGFFGTVASVGILLGFILFYIVPFLPFLYFMFAVGGWIKGIFEAMVGVPLWALAHLRIDGEGLPGEAAINGYFLIFEIFIRPILILFGFIASIIIFGALIKVLNSIFSLIVSNVGGFSNVSSTGTEGCTSIAVNTGTPGTIEWLRGPVDEFFFTILYAIVVYMTGMSCFKLIDQVPNNILRWMGQGVQTFNDQAGEPAEGLLSKIAIGGSMMSQNLQIAGNLRDTASQAAEGVKQLAGSKP